MNNEQWDRDEVLPPKLAEDLCSLRESIRTNELLRAKLRKQLLSGISSASQDRPRPSNEHRPSKTIWKWASLAAACLAAGLLLYSAVSGPDAPKAKDVQVVRQAPVLTLGSDTVANSLAISNDTRFLAYEKNGTIWIRGLDGGFGQELLPAPAGGAYRTPAFSADGSKVAVSMQQREQSKIAVISIRSRQVQLLTSPPPGYSDSQPVYSKDGEYIAFIRSKTQAAERGTDADGELWIMRADGSRAEKIADRASEPAWSPDGKRLAFSRLQQGEADNRREIWLVNKNGAGEKLLSVGQTPVWSPNGDSLAYVNSVSDVRDLQTGSDAKPLYQVEERRQEIWLIDINGQTKTPLTNVSLETDVRPIWVADPYNLYFVRLVKANDAISLQRLELAYK